jgi:hypothetical protein
MKHLALCLAFVAAAPAAAQSPDTPPDWSALAVADVEAAYAETKANHPGMFDPTNRDFPALLERARTEALDYARQTTTAGGFAASLQRFAAVLDDGHAGAYAALPHADTPPVRWPGFVAAWRGDAMYVYKSAAGGPAEGSKIESCNGRPVEELVRTNVFAWRTGVKTPGEWWYSARRLFVDGGNPFVTLPQTCRFVSAGKAEDRTLTWGPVPEYYQQWRDGASNGDLLPIGLVERAPGIQWIAMPDFQPDDAGVAAYKALDAELAAKADALRGARAVVLDLRFNQGGSSAWSYRIAQALWGKEAVDTRADAKSARQQVWWRPTPGNLASLRELVDRFKREDDPESVAWAEEHIALFEKAIASNETWVVKSDPAPADRTIPAPLLTAPVYVIVPGQCASACLDAIDVFKLFPRTILIGAPSGSDSTYMEVRNPVLPSGKARAIIPMKMYVNRPRGNGEFYPADIEMRDLDWSTAHFLRRIEEDLARR